MQQRSNSSPAPLATYAKLVAVPAIWGGTFIAGRVLALAIASAFIIIDLPKGSKNLKAIIMADPNSY